MMTWTWNPVSGATSYAYDVSKDGGRTWSTTRTALGATSPKTLAVPVGCRYGDAAHGAACRFRLYAKNAVGFGVSSAPVGPVAWGTAAPGPPRSLKVAATSSAYSTVTASWLAPTDTGGLPVSSYRIQVSNDGAPFADVPWSPVSTTSHTETAGTCNGNASCAYRAFATTANGESVSSNVATVSVTPGPVIGLQFDTAAELDPDPVSGAAGETPLRLTWSRPGTGITSGYQWAVQPVTSTTSGVRTSGAWSSPTDVGTDTAASLGCPSGSTTCDVQVRAYDDRAGASRAFGPWVAVDFRPWAPFSLGGGVPRDLSSRRTNGAIVIDVAGPAEGGPGPKTSAVKTFDVQACDEVATSGCAANRDWTTVSAGGLAYPTGQHATIDVSGPCAANDACSLRVRLVDAVATVSGAFKIGTYKGLWSVKETAAGQ
jgi:hypothetical protein